uniref:Uncharacterized protein n=1 Tax=Anopheles darlingi TaxID=43151 RepID=A0A2M4DN47_ANODA
MTSWIILSSSSLLMAATPSVLPLVTIVPLLALTGNIARTLPMPESRLSLLIALSSVPPPMPPVSWRKSICKALAPAHLSASERFSRNSRIGARCLLSVVEISCS